MFLKQSTASQTRSTPVFVDSTDFKTVKTGLTIANTDVKISVNGGAQASKNSGGGTHLGNGSYALTFDATDTATVGQFYVTINVAGALPVFFTFTVVEEAVYDMLMGSGAIGYIANQPVDVNTIKTNAVVNGGTVTFPTNATLASTTNITGGTITTVTTVTNQLTAAQIATGVWQDTTAGDFTTASSIGKSLYTSGAVPGAAGGLFIAGTNAATVVTTSFTTTFTGNLTGNVGGNVTGSVGSIATGGIATTSFAAGAIDAAAIAANAIGASELATDAVSEIAAGVWDLATSGHTNSGTFGEAMNAAGSAGDPWTTTLPGSYTSGQAGKIVGDNLNATVGSRSTQTSVDTIAGYLDTEVAAILAAVDTEVAAILADTNELQTDWANDGRLDVILDARASQTSVNTIDSIVDSILLRQPPSVQGIVAASPSPTTGMIATDRTDADNDLNDQLLVFTSGTLSGIPRFINYNTLADGLIFVDEVWPRTPSAGDTFSVFSLHGHSRTQLTTAIWTHSNRSLDNYAAMLAALGLASGNLDTQLGAIAADLPQRITKNVALAGFTFLMVDSADHVTGKTGLTVTATRSLDGAAFGACANAVSEIANGAYKIDLAAADLNANVVMLKFTATGADARFITIVTEPT